jgi:hypothetical protein
VVGVLVDDDLVTAPQPIVAEGIVVWCDAEVESAEPETLSSPAFEPEDVVAAETAGEAAVLPRVIEVVVSIAAAGIMSEPPAVLVHVGDVRVAGHIDLSPLRSGRRRTVLGYETAAEGVTAGGGMTTAASTTTSGVCKRRMRNHHHYD